MTTSAGSKNSGSSGSKFGQPNQGLLEGVFVHNRAQGFWAARQRTRYGVGEPEFGAFYAETGAAPGAPDDLQHGGV